MAPAIKSNNTTTPIKGSSSAFHDNITHQNQLHHFQSLLKTPSTTGSVPGNPSKANKKLNYSDSSSGSARQLLPVLVCLLTFATVLSVLIIYMDTTEIRHQQFRLNMTRDYDLVGVEQDDPLLITYIREVYLRRYSNSPVRILTSPMEHQQMWDYRGRTELTPRMAQYVIEELLAGKKGGVFVQSMTGANEGLMTAQWLSGGGQWTGVIVEPELRKYFAYRKEMGGMTGVEVMHACVSPNEYPKEVDWRVEGKRNRNSNSVEMSSEVKINSLLGEDLDADDDGDETEAGRVKCFPLYTILLATNRTKVDLLSLGCHGQHLQILETVPFDRVEVGVISLHFAYEEDTGEMLGSVSKFLYGKGFEFVRRMGHSYFYQAISSEEEVERENEEKVEGEKVEGE